MRTILGIIRMLMFVVGSMITVPLAWLIRETTGNVKGAQLFHGMACLVFNIRVRTIGQPREYAQTPTVFLSNHLSYLDIVVLGARIKARFVAKAEVAGWPVFGSFSKVQRTIFIERTRAALEGAKDVIAGALHEGYNIILFGEGTSTDGRTVLPFKAGLLEMLYEPGINAKLQPIAIVIERAAGKNPADQAVRDIYAWWRKEDELAPHLWALACTVGGIDIAVHYLPVHDPAAFADRKALAQAATQSVAGVLASS